MSLKSSLWRYLGLLAVAALAVGVFAGPASAKKLSAKQRAAIRKQLRKQIKKHPGVIKRKSFVKRASLVNFTLPVTIKLRGADRASNPNTANVDLGASLGQRTLNLGGTLAAEIKFHDSYDGGALGNVDLSILPSATKHLTSTSLPLLWNTQVSDNTTNWDSSLIGAANEGCGDFLNGAAPSAANGGVAGSIGFYNALNPAQSMPGVPFYNSETDPATSYLGFLPEIPGPDGLDKLSDSGVPGNDNLGANPTPFPDGYGPTQTGGSTEIGAENYQDAVLRTGSLDLGVAQAGTPVDMSTGAPEAGNTLDNASDSQNIIIGKSGGQANLFGNIPGKAYGIDVTVSLETAINSIIREVAPDPERLIAGDPYPPASFACRQAWTGAVQNYIPGVHLKGNLHISPAITRDGLRIAKASLSSLGDPAHVALAACLSPYTTYATVQDANAVVPNGSNTNTTTGMDTTSVRPIDEAAAAQSAPSGVACNAPADTIVQNSGFTQVPNITPGDGYTTTDNGSKVSVAGDISVQDVEADVLIGDN